MAKTVLVTGGARGIGRACAEAFAKAGWRVLVHYNQSEEAARRLCGALTRSGADCRLYRADFARKNEIAAMFEALEHDGESPDALVNNAAVAEQKLLTDITDGDWERMLAVDLSAAFYCCRAALPAMIRRKSGAIVNISSIWGLTGASCEVHYSAAKAGLIGLTKALAKEVGPSGVRVNCVAPGVIDTAMLAGFKEAELDELRGQTPLGRLGAPEDIAAAVLFLAGDGAGFITGQVVCADGGMTV